MDTRLSPPARAPFPSRRRRGPSRVPDHLRPRRLVLLVLALACALSAIFSACDDPQPSPLTPEEQRLVDETLLVLRLRIERARDPVRAERLRAELPSLLTDEQLQARLDALAVEPLRGQRVLDAIHDSLRAMREEIFPPAQDGQDAAEATPRAGGATEPD